ncbi:hypothetical protein CUR178_01005 [Leishmania enriettii]|uniref:USP domain-containing protein n=1 Tax=Leishmania enriettii TaxID=5663 RepID=A0A836KCJ7_LEIEN|nr:hypothetical protein CUR178_01005 [Leishmania enriettii]
MPSDQQQQLSHRSREQRASGFVAGGSQSQSLSDEFSPNSQARLLSDTACNASSRAQPQRDGVFMKRKSLLPSRSSVVRSSAQGTPLRSDGAAATPAAAAAAAITGLAARSYPSKGAAARNEEGIMMSSVSGRYSCDCGSLGVSLRDLCSLTTPLTHSVVDVANNRDELPSVTCTESATATQRAHLHADSNVPADTTVMKGPLLGFSMSASHNMPWSAANEGLTLFPSSSQRSLSMPRRVAERQSAGVASLCSSINASMSASACSPQSGYQGGGGSLRVWPSDIAARNTATPSPPARLNLLPSKLYPSSTPAARMLSPPNLSRRCSRTIRTTATCSKPDASSALASLRRSPSLHSGCTGTSSDVTSAVSAAPSAQGLTGADSAGPVLVTLSLPRGDTSISPRQPHPLLSASTSSQSHATVQSVTEKKSAECTATLSGNASSSSHTPRLQPQLQYLQQSGAAVMVNASSAAAAAQPDRHDSTGASATGALSAIQLHSAPIPLRNFGSTCYLNSVVQCLLCTPGLLRALDNDRQRIVHEWEVGSLSKTKRTPDSAHRRSCAERKAPATSSLIDLGTARPAHCIPVPQLLLSLKAACATHNNEFMSNGQNDAHEFLITLLGVIDKEVRRSKPGSYEAFRDVEDEKKSDAYARWLQRLLQENNSTVYDFFGGVTGCTVKCASCRLISYRFEALLAISLPITYRDRTHGGKTANALSCEKRGGRAQAEGLATVDELLREMFFNENGEFLSGPMQVTCDRCKKLRNKTIWLSMEQWPPVLVLHLKRFNNAGLKNEAAVIFPYTFRPFEHVNYQLYAICCHRGTSSYGHYTSYIYVQEADEAAAARKSTSAVAAQHPYSSKPSRKSMNSDPTAPPWVLQDSGRADGVGRASGDGGEGVGEVRIRKGNGRPDEKSENVTAAATTTTGRWYLCNDAIITEVTASDVLSMTREAYILFYRRVDDRGAKSY